MSTDSMLRPFIPLFALIVLMIPLTVGCKKHQEATKICQAETHLNYTSEDCSSCCSRNGGRGSDYESSPLSVSCKCYE